MNVTQGSGWAWHAYRAATDRLAVPGRTLDPGFVAGLEADVIAVARETGEDARDALDGLHEGLAAAVAPPCPACGSQGRHSPSCADAEPRGRRRPRRVGPGRGLDRSEDSSHQYLQVSDT